MKVKDRQEMKANTKFPPNAAYKGEEESDLRYPFSTSHLTIIKSPFCAAAAITFLELLDWRLVII